MKNLLTEIDFKKIDKERNKLKRKIYRFFYWHIYNPIRNLPYDIYTLYHRSRYGWSPRDCWSLDAYICDILIGGIEWLYKHKIGLPTWKEGRIDEEAEQEWNEILKTLIYGFWYMRECIVHDCVLWNNWTKDKKLPCNKCDINKIKKATFKVLEKWFFALWD